MLCIRNTLNNKIRNTLKFIKKKKKPIQSKSLNQIRNFGLYRPLQPLIDDRRSDFSKSVHSGTKTLSLFLLIRTVVFSFLSLRFLWVDEVVNSLVNNASQVYLLAHCLPLYQSLFWPHNLFIDSVPIKSLYFHFKKNLLLLI